MFTQSSNLSETRHGRATSPSPTPTAAVSAGTRSRILDAAEAVFGVQGFRKTKLEEIAAAAGVSRPLVYRYFHNKGALYGVVVERVLREWNEVLVAEAARTTPGTAHKLRLVLTACLRFARERTVLQGLLARDASLVRAKYGDLFEGGNSLLRDLVGRILDDGMQRGDVRMDLALDDMAHVVSEVFISYTFRVLAGGTGQVGERRVYAIVETLLHGVIAQPPLR